MVRLRFRRCAICSFRKALGKGIDDFSFASGELAKIVISAQVHTTGQGQGQGLHHKAELLIRGPDLSFVYARYTFF